MIPNILVISDSGTVAHDLRQQLDKTGEYYNLKQCKFSETSRYLNSQNFDQIFAAPFPEKDVERLQAKINYLATLKKNTNINLTIVSESNQSNAIKKLQQRSPEITYLPQSDINHNNDSLISAIFGASIAEREAARQRSQEKSKEIAELHRKIERQQVRIEQLEDETERFRLFFDGGSSGNGVLSAIAHFWHEEKENNEARETLASLESRIEELRHDFDDLLQQKRDLQGNNWQRQLALLGVAGAIVAGIVQVFLSSHLEDMKAKSQEKNAAIEFVAPRSSNENHSVLSIV